jgi:hypothetical protein
MSSRRLLIAILGLGSASVAVAQVQFRLLDRDVIELRLQGYSRKNSERVTILKKLFAQSGCAPDQLSEQKVKGDVPPNVICTEPGRTDDVILVGAHSDHAEFGDGVVDNWSGASLLPSLLYSISAQPRRHTFVFVGFTGEEKGMLGSDFYAYQLSKEQRAKIEGMVNLDTLGLGPTEVWLTHSDTNMLDALAKISVAMKIPVTEMDVDKLGTTDSESFAKYHIPRITIHSVTQATWSILHSKKDRLDAIKIDDYYTSYRLLAAYLAFLDNFLGSKPVTPSAQPVP